MTRVPEPGGGPTASPGAEERKRAEALFEQVLDLPAGARDGFLEAACRDHPDRIHRVRALLRAHDRGGGILDGPRPDAPFRRRPGPIRYGPYRILHSLGRGGMGEVFLAVREDAFMRRVALKVIGDGRATAEARQRFETERRILASLSHPNIAQLLDGGVTEDGTPYLVMEYVEGLPLTTWCDRERLTVDERLVLFRKVCGAVHHAHQNLVIHRDLKPSNILVTAAGEPKLLDFGIAKLQQAASPALAQPVTRPGLRALTPEYASPEQLRGDPVTTAADVFALGVLLYELLAGVAPFPADGPDPVARVEAVCTQDPVRPSAAAQGREDATRLAVARGASPSELTARLRGDLDAIAETALRKEPGRRYPSAEHLSTDIERHLRAEPVLAVGRSRGYRLGKFLRRHRWESLSAAAVAVVLIVGGVTASWQAGLARNERDRAALARDRAEASNAFVLGLFAPEDPLETLGERVSARTMLERGLAQADALEADPTLRGRLRAILARAHWNLGAYPRAAELYRAAAADLASVDAEVVGTPSAPGRADVGQALAETLKQTGDFAEALRVSRRARGLLEATLGGSHPRVAELLVQEGSILVYLADLAGADSVTRMALARQSAAHGDHHPSVTRAMEALALVVLRRGGTEEAEALLREVLRRRGPHGEADSLRRTLTELRLARLVAQRPDRIPEAEALFRQVLLELPPDHMDRATTLAELADALASRDRRDEALELYARALELRRVRWSPDHTSVADLQMGIGRIAVEAGDLDRAEAAYRDALRIWQGQLGPDHPSNAYGLLGLADVAVARGRLPEAEVLARQAVAVRDAALVPDHSLRFIARAALGDILGRQGRVQEGEGLLLEAREALAAELGPDHPEVREVEGTLDRLRGTPTRGHEAAAPPF